MYAFLITLSATSVALDLHLSWQGCPHHRLWHRPHHSVSISARLRKHNLEDTKWVWHTHGRRNGQLFLAVIAIVKKTPIIEPHAQFELATYNLSKNEKSRQWTRQFDLTTSYKCLLIVSPIWGKYFLQQDAYKSQSWTTCAPTPPPCLSSVILSPPKPPSREEPRIKRGRISSMQYDSADNF